ncbi:MAG TPA: VCBS repeat-containing protein [Pyrinomonadaceae bacterium]|jgi:hypothetical protein
MNSDNSTDGIHIGDFFRTPLFTSSNSGHYSAEYFFKHLSLSIFFLTLLLAGTSQRTLGQNISFSAPTKYGSGGAASMAITAGDFNGDGKADLAVANQDSDNAGILLGNGDGTFSAATPFPTGYSPKEIAKSDLNGDGKLDLVIANETGNNVSVLMGNGDSSFQAPANYGSVDRPEYVAIADLSLDGKQDLAVAGFGGSVYVFKGNGDGTFQTPVSYSTGMASTSIIVEDLNKDGKPDMAVTNQDSGNLSVLVNLGDGTFSPAVNYGTAPYPVSISTGDFNGDGNLDLVTADMGPYSNGYFGGNGFVSILLGRGDGTFQGAVSYGVGMVPHSVAVGDINQDGAPELVVANAYSNAISILGGNGDGSFSAAINISTGDPSTPFSVCLADFNGDGRLDVATANFVDSSVTILINQTITSLTSSIGSKSYTTGTQSGKTKSSPKPRR